MPTEHGANNSHKHLDDSHATLAEIFDEAGYDTFCFAANPHISAEENFTQGFDVVEHPWDRENFTRALAIVESKLQAEEIRRRRYNKAERQAARAPSLMLIPTALFILPAVFIIIIVPIAIKAMESGVADYMSQGG